MRTAGLRLACVALAAACLASCASAPESVPANAKWYGVYVDDGSRVGASSSAVTPWQGGERTVETFELLSRREKGGAAQISDRIERFTDAHSRTTRIERVTDDGRDPVRVTIDIRDGAAIAVRKTRYDQTTVRVELPSSVRFDGGYGLLPGWDFAAGNDLAFDNFNAGAMAVERVVMRLLGSDAATGERRIERTAYRDGRMSTATELSIDASGQVVRTTLEMFGARIVVRAISEAEARGPVAAANLMGSVMVKSPHRIPNGAAQGHIRYAFGFNEGRVFAFPETHEQKVTRTGDEVILDICANCGPGLSKDPKFLADGLRSTMWLQRGSNKLRELAAFAPGETLSDRKKMELLGARAKRTMTKLDFNGHYSALEAAERGVGDCAEDALLLTALARAAGIPAYVATGLVYSRERYHGVSNVFAPHNWTLAYVDGEWASFDISLGEFDATHIALSINEGEASAMASAQQLSSQLEWRRMTEVRADPAQ